MTKKEKIELGIEFLANRRALMFAIWLNEYYLNNTSTNKGVNWFYEKLKDYNTKVFPSDPEDTINAYNDFIMKKMNIKK